MNIEQSLDQCIKCNICTSSCPVCAVTDLFPGPKFVAPQAGRFRQNNQPTPDRSVDYCSGCRVCNMVCPTGVKIAEINARARASIVHQGKTPIRLRFRNNMIARVELLGKFAQPIAPLSNLILSNKTARLIGEKTLGIAQNAPFPPYTNKKFTSWFKQHASETNYQNAYASSGRPKVVYFHGCSTQYFEPHVGQAAVHVLEANGFEVINPHQNCCGLPLLSNGEFSAARRYHINNVRHLVEFARLGIPIVGTSTSCTLTLKEEAPELLDMRDEDTLLVAQHTYDLSEFLVCLLRENQLNLDFQAIPLKVSYHIPCQYRAHRLGKPGLELLLLIPELIVVESQASCCGIAGTYGYKEEKYSIALQVGTDLFDFIAQSKPSLVLCESETCRWQITHITDLPSIHPIELLAYSYGFVPEGILQSILLKSSYPQ